MQFSKECPRRRQKSHQLKSPPFFAQRHQFDLVLTLVLEDQCLAGNQVANRFSPALDAVGNDMSRQTSIAGNWKSGQSSGNEFSLATMSSASPPSHETWSPRSRAVRPHQPRPCFRQLNRWSTGLSPNPSTEHSSSMWSLPSRRFYRVPTWRAL